MAHPRNLVEDDVALELLPDRETLTGVPFVEIGPITMINAINVAVAVNAGNFVPVTSTAVAGMGIGVTQL